MPRLPSSIVQQASRQHRLLPLLLRECRDISSAQNELRWLAEHAGETRTNVRKMWRKRAPRNVDAVPRWLHKGGHNAETRVEGVKKLFHTAVTARDNNDVSRTLLKYALRRSRGEPIQYILGNQPFSDLEILCLKDVLIPRPETEAYTTKLAEMMEQILRDRSFGNWKTRVDGKLRILDLCTGTGCIALLLHSLLQPIANSEDIRLEIVGLDISETAVSLARQNLQYNIVQGHLHASAANQISFVQSDVLQFGAALDKFVADTRALTNIAGDYSKLSKEQDMRSMTQEELKAFYISRRDTLLRKLLQQQSLSVRDTTNITFDVVIANPPYISPLQYEPGGTTARSVRRFEPKLALVPPTPAAHPDLTGKASNDHAVDPQSLTDDHQADLFYPVLMEIGKAVGARVLLMEVGDSAQASRVASHINKTRTGTDDLEVWRDDGSEVLHDGFLNDHIANCMVEGRAVILWKGRWARWRRKMAGGKEIGGTRAKGI